ncbi:hypothetical protein AMTR_s00064p00148730 [Amborella trichopoda]|uniref:L-ascorbate oxidase n=1 Tax=Amborella trichopoda TaxID=13333 RepID=U5DC44_AMBTC|nr:hypothetical protein AMTR_s00064p00148730 [Amborella trichopoda]
MLPLMVESRIRHFKWEVNYLPWSPDCSTESLLIAINGHFPGPTIRARAGDAIVVELHNKLPTEGVFESPWADGTASISQCAINPEETFIYRFKVDKAGTYFYHGHHGMQRSAGLYGSLIVEVAEGKQEPFHYNAELSLLLSDWWHQSIYQQMVDLHSKPFRWIGEPQSLLIEGKGRHNCSLKAYEEDKNKDPDLVPTTLCPKNNKSECAPHVLQVEPNKTYRLRIASVTSLASLNFAFGNHKLVLVEADGSYIQPVTVESLDIYSGETYSLLLHTNQDPSTNYWASASIISRHPKTPPGLAILNYRPNPSSLLPRSAPPTPPKWNDTARAIAFARKIVADPLRNTNPPASAIHRIVLLNTQNKINGYTKWAINNVSLVLPATPYLGSIRYGLHSAFDFHTNPPEDFPENYDIFRPPQNPNATTGNAVYKLKLGSTVDVILQNANLLTEGTSEVHPWHLHGHDFWVLGFGDGRFNWQRDAARFNLKDPPRKNTVALFPYGWTAIRFVADNPGVWAFHCHIEPHLHMGMGVVIAEGVDRVRNVPRDVLGCGMTRRLIGPHGP